VYRLFGPNDFGPSSSSPAACTIDVKKRREKTLKPLKTLKCGKIKRLTV